jgi:lipopolysaccharide export system protein LptC
VGGWFRGGPTLFWGGVPQLYFFDPPAAEEEKALQAQTAGKEEEGDFVSYTNVVSSSLTIIQSDLL